MDTNKLLNHITDGNKYIFYYEDISSMCSNDMIDVDMCLFQITDDVNFTNDMIINNIFFWLCTTRDKYKFPNFADNNKKYICGITLEIKII